MTFCNKYIRLGAHGSIRQCTISGDDCDGGCDDCDTARQHEQAEKGPYVRPEVAAFAGMMESVLSDHDGDKGNSWKDSDLDLWPKFHEKYDDLCCFCSDSESDRENLIDLANYAMMMWHRLGTDVRYVYV